ncbi:gamma-aminobutyric acid type B receptor subunit 2-like [Glandiceps talaboti]
MQSMKKTSNSKHFEPQLIISSNARSALNLAGLFPFDTYEWAGGQGSLPAAELALSHVNAREDILHGYELKMIWKDSKCNAGDAVDATYRMLYSEPPKIMMIGPACSTACQVTASAVRHWGVVQVSYTCSAAFLSDKTKYPLFTRVVTPSPAQNIARVALMKEYGWRKVATIFENLELWAEMNTELIDMLEGADMIIITSENFLGDPSTEMKRMKRKGARIIIGLFYAESALKIFCEAYKLEMYGPKYAWMMPGWFGPNWVSDTWYDGIVDCTQEQVEEVLKGTLSVSPFSIHHERDKKGISDLTPNEYFDEYDRYVNYTGDTLTGYTISPRAYDAIWAISLALNNTMNTLESSNGTKRLENFTYGDQEMSEMIMKSFHDISFDGVSGSIQFNKEGEILADFSVQQYQDGTAQQVGIYRADSGIIHFNSEVPIVWRGDGPPIDDVSVVYVVTKVPTYVYYLMVLLTVCGMICGSAFLVFNFKFRRIRIIKMSSPNINNIILCGCLLTYASVLPANVDGFNTDPLLCCKISIYLLLLGFSLTYGALFSKTWRVHRIFTNKYLEKRAVKDRQLLIAIIVIVGIDISIMAVWEGLDPLLIIIRDSNELPTEIGDKVYINQIAFCESSKLTYWLAIIYAIKAIILLFGGFLAWETRKVNIAVLNDSRYIGMCIYNVVILSGIGAPLIYVLRSDPALSYSITSTFVILGTTVTQCLVCLPKIMAYKAGETVTHGPNSIRPTRSTAVTFGDTDDSMIESAVGPSTISKRMIE